MAMAALFMQATVVRTDLLQARQRMQRVIDLPQVSLAARHEVEHLDMVRRLRRQALDGLQGLRMLPVRMQLMDTSDAPLQRRGSGIGCHGVHADNGNHQMEVGAWPTPFYVPGLCTGPNA
ncbi:hypothetical protein GCM10027066_14960 [Dyella jejuensis]